MPDILFQSSVDLVKAPIGEVQNYADQLNLLSDQLISENTEQKREESAKNRKRAEITDRNNELGHLDDLLDNDFDSITKTI